jgi:hypothetical protein
MLTMRMGSKGPKISSFIIRESQGTSTSMVGEIFLPSKIKFPNEKQIAPSYKILMNQENGKQILTGWLRLFHLHRQSF